MTTGALRDSITVQSESNSQVFSIRVENENPYQAAEITNATAGIFQERIFDIMNVDNVTIISEATPNMNPASPNNLLNIMIGFLLGAMIGIGLIFLRELVDNSVKSKEQAEKITGWHNLGEVNYFSKEDLVVKTPLPKKKMVSNEKDTTTQQTRRRV